MRACGMLLPVSSLPSPYGIGAFSESAYRFVDTLKEAGQKYWQILPLGPTSYGDSPYQSFSTFAGNPYFIDLDQLIKEGLLLQEECDACDFEKECLVRRTIYSKYDIQPTFANHGNSIGYVIECENLREQFEEGDRL